MSTQNPSNNPSYLSKLTLLLLLKTALLILVILYAGIGLGPDEAQYWTWSRDLDWGYYSKPPGIAWQIWLGCQLCGNTELGVRLISLFFGIFLSLSVYFLSRAVHLKPQTAFWAGVIMAFSPLGVLGAFLAITDGGLALFWTLACLVVALALYQRVSPNYYILGLLIMSGALFKWPIYLFWVVVLLLIALYRFAYHPSLFAGIALSLLGLLPSVIWNYQHDWGTFRHVFSTIKGGEAKDVGTMELPHGNFWDFFGAQAALLSPILFGILLVAFGYLLRRRNRLSPPLFFCGGVCLLFLLAYSGMALFQKMQGNWASFIYSSGIVFLCWFACEEMPRGLRWVKWGLGLSVGLILFAFSIPAIQSHAGQSWLSIPYKINPFRQNLGWSQLKEELALVGYHPEEHFLFGDKYQTSSILSFYGPSQKRAYFLNLHGLRHNQFSYWPGMAQEQIGKSGFFVLPENNPHLENGLEQRIAFYQKTLADYFQEVHFLGVKPLFISNGQLAKGALIFKCISYNGKEPAESSKY